jgi:hypothetical protein
MSDYSDEQIKVIKRLQWEMKCTFKEVLDSFTMEEINQSVIYDREIEENKINLRHVNGGFSPRKLRNNGKEKALNQMTDQRRSLGKRYKPIQRYRIFELKR